MKCYKIEFLTSFAINFVIFALICTIFIMIWRFPTLTSKDYIGYSFAGIVTVGLLTYLLKIKFAIAKDCFKEIIVDKTNRTFTFITKKSESCTVNFDDVEGVYMIQGEILRGLPMGYVDVRTKDNRSLSLAVTKINDFYVNLPNNLNKNLEEYIFFRTNK